MTFETLGLSQETVKKIQQRGFTEPTQIQKESIPLIVKKQDVIGESATGSGKTLAFGCGITEHVKKGAGLQAIVLTPTRELAEQLKHELEKLCTHKIALVYGGVGYDQQISACKKSEVVVATPGRMLDHLRNRAVDLSKISLLILDEADRMFDMGFVEDVEEIISGCPKQRQTLFFSATISDRVKELARKHMKSPSEVAAKNQVDPSKLTQVYYDVKKNMKLALLTHFIKEEREGLVMVFCNTRRAVDFVGKTLRANKVDAIVIHGGLTQNKRTHTMKRFNDGNVHVLVCTDVAARGLHVDNVSHVYNFDIPKDPKEYVHRIGRTARAGEEGKVINILSDMDYENFSRIIDTYKEFKIEQLEVPYLKKVKVEGLQQRRPQKNEWRWH